MATYRYTNNTGASLKLNERPVYGSSRLGSLRKEVELHTLPSFDPASANPVQQVDLNYELTDHLGNVCAVVTGRLLDGNGGGTAKQAELVSAQGYEPFGSLLPGRNYSSGNYRFGFGGKENDNEMHGAVGTCQDFGARMYDNRLARFFAPDPKCSQYPELSPYAFAGNSPIQFTDINGENPGVVVVVIGGVVITIADAALIGMGVMTTGILLHKAMDGTLAPNYSYSPGRGWEGWKEQQRREGREQGAALAERLAHMKMVKDYLERVGNNERGDGNQQGDPLGRFARLILGGVTALWAVDNLRKTIPGAGDTPDTEMRITDVSTCMEPQGGFIEVAVQFDVFHQVQPGENLTLIAKRYGTSVDRLVSENCIEDRDLIQAGTDIKVGSGTTTMCVPGPQ